MLLERGGQAEMAIEVKRSSAPSLDKGFGIACDDLELSKRYLVYPGKEAYAVRHGAQAIGMAELATLLFQGA